MEDSAAGRLARAGYLPVPGKAAAAANATWWSGEAGAYLAEHGDFLGDADFCWCPEGLREADARLLGPLEALRGRRVLEIGAGAAQCSRWLVSQGVEVVATDVAPGMVAAAAELDAAHRPRRPDAGRGCSRRCRSRRPFDVVFTAFGAIPFVPDADAVHREVARVLRPGGRWVFSVTHPVRWAFPDDPTTAGLTAVRSYFDRTPYVESDADGEPIYAEFHRTLGDHVRDIVAAGFALDALVEPEWPADHDGVWGGWGPERGAVLPGTVIFQCRLPAR